MGKNPAKLPGLLALAAGCASAPPAAPPAGTGPDAARALKVRRVSPCRHRCCFNYRAFSHMMPFRDRPRGGRVIDRRAPHGINGPLAVTGQEAVRRDNREPSTAAGITCTFPPRPVRYLRGTVTGNSAHTGRHRIEVLTFERQGGGS